MSDETINDMQKEIDDLQQLVFRCGYHMGRAIGYLQDATVLTDASDKQLCINKALDELKRYNTEPDGHT